LTTSPTQQRFAEALGVLVEHVKKDNSILAAILCGTLSPDAVWSRGSHPNRRLFLRERRAMA
jgi:hypothetical protein